MRSFVERLACGETVNDLEPGFDEYLAICRRNRDLLIRYNTVVMSEDERRSLLSEIICKPVPEDSGIFPPFQCDLGVNIHLGKKTMLNYNSVLLDTVSITIGDNTMIGPGVHIVTACHPLESGNRRCCELWGKPVNIGKDVWFGANVTVLPGVTIGDRAVIGAGSVVTKDVPSDVVVVGNPAHVVKRIDNKVDG